MSQIQVTAASAIIPLSPVTASGVRPAAPRSKVSSDQNDSPGRAYDRVAEDVSGSNERTHATAEKSDAPQRKRASGSDESVKNKNPGIEQAVGNRQETPGKKTERFANVLSVIANPQAVPAENLSPQLKAGSGAIVKSSSGVTDTEGAVKIASVQAVVPATGKQDKPAQVVQAGLNIGEARSSKVVQKDQGVQADLAAGTKDTAVKTTAPAGTIQTAATIKNHLNAVKSDANAETAKVADVPSVESSNSSASVARTRPVAAGDRQEVRPTTRSNAFPEAKSESPDGDGAAVKASAVPTAIKMSSTPRTQIVQQPAEVHAAGRTQVAATVQVADGAAPTVGTQGAQTAPQAETTSPTDQIIQQIQASNNRLGEQIVIRLNPPELGQVRITLQMEGDGVRGVIHADNARTFEELQREAPLLVQRMAESGVNLRRVEVNFTGQDGSNGSNEAHAQLHDGNGNHQRDLGDQAAAGADDSALQGDLEDETVLAGAWESSDGSVNVWM